MRKWALSTLLSTLAITCGTSEVAAPDRLQSLRTFAAPVARQAVAVDGQHFYAIDDRRIEKYAKASGKRVATWSAGDDASIEHLNSGIVLDGRLYCAHSNYPHLPMRSSIEVFDAETLTHRESRPLPYAPGSATWVDRREGRWWVAFAHYAGRGGAPGLGPEHSRLVAYDAAWNETARYAYPPALVERFAGYSNSGGAWGPDGRLYATGHDAAEVYVLSPPAESDTLEWLETRPAPIAGQGIAWDPAEEGRLWGVVRGERRIVVMRSR
jgi:outer membrane protein assembly factor BamB